LIFGVSLIVGAYVTVPTQIAYGEESEGHSDSDTFGLLDPNDADGGDDDDLLMAASPYEVEDTVSPYEVDDDGKKGNFTFA
jgi:hypothetical protein